MSKELEALDKVKDIIKEDGEDIDNPTLLVNEISIIEKALKTLEIIKEKQVNVEIFVEVIKQFELRPNANSRVSLWTITDREEDVKEKFDNELELYNRTCLYGLSHLTQEEFDLLKEVLL